MNCRILEPYQIHQKNGTDGAKACMKGKDTSDIKNRIIKHIEKNYPGSFAAR